LVIYLKKSGILEEILQISESMLKMKYIPILCIPMSFEEFDLWLNCEERSKFNSILRIPTRAFLLDFDLPLLVKKKSTLESFSSKRRSQSLALVDLNEKTETAICATFVCDKQRIIAEYRNLTKHFDFSRFKFDPSKSTLSLKKR
jgi:hypothetical protein